MESMQDADLDLLAARKYEAWYTRGFGRRADLIERRLLSEALRSFRQAGSLLEVGSGTGHFADLWHEAGLHAAGVDLARDRLKLSRHRNPAFPVVLGDATSLPFQDNSYDLVALVTALEFIELPLRALEEATRVARSGLLIGTLNRWSPVTCWRRMRQVLRRRRRSSYEGAGFFSPPELEKMVRVVVPETTRVRWCTGLYPVPWLDGVTTLPLGAFIVMTAVLGKEGE